MGLLGTLSRGLAPAHRARVFGANGAHNGALCAVAVALGRWDPGGYLQRFCDQCMGLCVGLHDVSHVDGHVGGRGAV